MKQLIVEMTENASAEDQSELQACIEKLYFALTNDPSPNHHIKVIRPNTCVTVVDDTPITSTKEDSELPDHENILQYGHS